MQLIEKLSILADAAKYAGAGYPVSAYTEMHLPLRAARKAIDMVA